MYVYIRSLKFTVESSGDLGVPFVGAPRASGASAGSLSVSESEMDALTLRSSGRKFGTTWGFSVQGFTGVFWRQLGIPKYLAGWWLTYPSEKYESQLG